MEIRINTAESGVDELTALIALCASLGGRLPDGSNTQFVGRVTRGPPIVEEARRIAAARQAEIASDEQEVPADQQGGPVTTSDVDSKGIPWDARIHSESKATVADGSWRKRRGVDDATFAAVMAELTDGADNDEAPPPPPPPTEGNDVPAPPAPTEAAPSEPEPAASAPVAGDPPASAGNGQFADFGAFVGAVSKHGKTYAELNEMAGVLGVPMFRDMKDHADKWDMFFGMIG